MCFEEVLLIELNRIFSKYYAKHFPEVVRWDRCVMVVELFVCFTYCPFLLLEEYLFTNQKSPLILVLVNLSVWIFPYTQCHATSFPYLDLTMWLKFLADLVSLILSCFLDLGLIHQSWRRGWDLFLAKHKR